MKTRTSPAELLQHIHREIHVVNTKIIIALAADDFSSQELDEWINLLNHLIRQLDHTVERLLALKE